MQKKMKENPLISVVDNALREARYFSKDVRKYLYEIEKKRPLTNEEKILWNKTHDVHVHTNDAELILQDNTIYKS